MAVTVETSPVAIQANSYSAELFRRGTFGWELQRGASVGSVVGGLVGGADLQVTYGGSGLNLAVAAGECIVPGSSASTQSGYYLRVTTAGTLTPAAASGANPRIDLVYAQVQDQAYTGSSNLGTVAIATGTPTGGASLSNLSGAPAVPTSAIAIAYILIPQSAATINNSDILNEYTMAYFGPNIFNATPTSTSGTASSGQHVIVSANSPTITLPVPFKNARVKVTNYGSGVVTVSHNASETIYGPGLGSGVSSDSVIASGGTVTVESDGTSWFETARGGQNYFGAGIGMNVSLGVNTLTKVFDTATLGVGTWDISMFALCENTGSGGGAFEAQAAVDTATSGTFQGVASAGNESSVSGEELPLSLRFIAPITTAGTLKLSIYATGSTANAALVGTRVETYAAATGYVAVRLD